MAEDARISTGFPRHHKTVKLKRRIGAEGCWSLICLFLWVADNRPEGDLRGMTDEDIEIAAEWGGEPGGFAKALAESGFIDSFEGSYKIHDWAEHNPYVAGRSMRQAYGRNAANVRWHGKRNADGCDMALPLESVSHN